MSEDVWWKRVLFLSTISWDLNRNKQTGWRCSNHIVFSHCHLVVTSSVSVCKDLHSPCNEPFDHWCDNEAGKLIYEQHRNLTSCPFKCSEIPLNHCLNDVFTQCVVCIPIGVSQSLLIPLSSTRRGHTSKVWDQCHNCETSGPWCFTNNTLLLVLLFLFIFLFLSLLYFFLLLSPPFSSSSSSSSFPHPSLSHTGDSGGGSAACPAAEGDVHGGVCKDPHECRPSFPRAGASNKVRGEQQARGQTTDYDTCPVWATEGPCFRCAL